LQRIVDEQVRRERPDVVFVHMIAKFVLVIAPICRLHAIPMLMWYTHGHLSWQARLAYALVDSVCTASPEGFRMAGAKVHPIGHGIDIQKFRPRNQPGAEARIVCVGRLSPSKDHPTLIKAMALLRDDGINVPPLQIIGQPWPGNERDALYAQALHAEVDALRLQSLVHFNGAMPFTDIQDIYDGAFTLLTSLTGSLDKAGLEAMACGSLLSTCNEAFAPIVAPIAPNLLFRRGEAEGCARSIRWMLQQSPDSRRRLGNALRSAVVREHGLESLMDRLLDECR